MELRNLSHRSAVILGPMANSRVSLYRHYLGAWALRILAFAFWGASLGVIAPGSEALQRPKEEPTAPAPSQTSVTAPDPGLENGDYKATPGSSSEQAGPSDAYAAAYQVPAARFSAWLKEVEPLIFGKERLAFLKLRTNYSRDAFIDRFWRSRDPYPETARNELRERWVHNLSLARSLYDSSEDDRARILLIHGPASSSFEVRCTLTRKPAEVWYYQRSPHLDFPFALVFLRHRGTGPGRIWRPGSFAAEDAANASRKCLNGEHLLNVMSQLRQTNDYELTVRRVLAKPIPRSSEWLATFVAFSTDLDPDVEWLDAELGLSFLGRYQSRTVTQGLLKVPQSASSIGELAGYRSYEFLLTGEVVAGDSLFENFRYKFGFPLAREEIGGDEGEFIPMAFQRYLRPGEYTLVLKLEDLNSGHQFRKEILLEVPQLDFEVASPQRVDPESAELFAEAAAAVARDGVTSIKIVAPRLDLLTGMVRFDTLAVGDDIERVAFSLDGKRLMVKNRPPYNVEIDLGGFPRVRNLVVEALDSENRQVATDRLMINAGGNRFSIELIEPQRGKTYESSLLARAEVEVPEGRSLERVEFYLNEDLVATVFQPPFSQPISLPSRQEVSFVRTVAYLPDGNSTEDLVFVNAPGYLEQVDIQFVELYTTVLDRAGRPVQGLGADAFRIIEDGSEQKISRFEAVGDLPIHVGVVLDNSGSMQGALNQARAAALRFFQKVIQPKDRAAVITFNRSPNLAVKLTNDLPTLGGGLAGLTAEGETALYDSIMFGLYYFTGIRGQRALLLLSDGKDEASRFDFPETLEYARRAGVTIYTIGLNLRDAQARQDLTELADETGGRSFFIPSASELEEIYDLIQTDLRSQYLLAYQSSSTKETEEFRKIEVKLPRTSFSAKTLSGYYP